MEVGFHSSGLKRNIYAQWVLFILLALGITFSGNVIVSAGPSTKITVGKDSRVPLSKRVLDPSKKWRTPKKKKKLWRELQENKLKIQQGRIKNKSSSLYGSIDDRENWDPYSFSDNQDIYTTPPTLFRFRF
jgi:hypothetical protein